VAARIFFQKVIANGMSHMLLLCRGSWKIESAGVEFSGSSRHKLKEALIKCGDSVPSAVADGHGSTS